MPLGSEHRLTGILLNTTNGFSLDVDGGGSWRLDLRDDRKARRLLGLRVVVNGRRSGFDLLDVDRLEALSDR